MYKYTNGKCPKILNTLFLTLLGQFCSLYSYFLKILHEKVNSVDLDQTAPQEQSDLGLHCLQMPFIGHFGVQNFGTFTIYIML